MTRLHDWTPDDDAPGAVVDVTNDTGWDEIRRYYFPTETFPSPNSQPEPAPKECRPLEHVIANVRAHHAKCVLIEYRYIDFGVARVP